MAGRDDEGGEGADPKPDDEGRAGAAGSRFGRMARKLMDRKELAEDTKDLLAAVLSSSDRAKTEAVKMVAREVRAYLDELKLKEDLVELISGYSLEVSLHLKPLSPEVKARNARAARGEEFTSPIHDSPTVKLDLTKNTDPEE